MLAAPACGATSLPMKEAPLPKISRTPSDPIEEYLRTSRPAAEHKLLERFVGKWRTNMRSFMNGTPGPEIEGTAEGKMVYGGRFLFLESVGKSLGNDVRVLTILGYDVFKKRYLASALGENSTTVYSSDGWADGHRLVLDGRMDDVFGDRPVRYVYTFDERAGRIVFEVFNIVNGAASRAVETVYTRLP